jgi:DNA-binding MarR family transcriptional regulator
MNDADLQEAVMRLKAEFERAGNSILIEQVGYGFSHLRLLKTIAHLHNPTQQMVARELNQTQAAVSRQIKLLIEDGLVSSTVNPKNRRERHLRVTTKGQLVANKAKKVASKELRQLFKGLDKTTLDQAVKILHKITDHLQKI